MRKIFLVTLLVAMFFSFTSCGDNNAEELYAEKSIDGIAECLGYMEGEDIDINQLNEEVEGALAGKDYGDVTIYEFDPQSAEYKEWLNAPGLCNKGFMLMISGDLHGEEIADISYRFENIKFE